MGAPPSEQQPLFPQSGRSGRVQLAAWAGVGVGVAAGVGVGVAAPPPPVGPEGSSRPSPQAEKARVTGRARLRRLSRSDRVMEDLLGSSVGCARIRRIGAARA